MRLLFIVPLFFTAFAFGDCGLNEKCVPPIARPSASFPSMVFCACAGHFTKCEASSVTIKRTSGESVAIEIYGRKYLSFSGRVSDAGYVWDIDAGGRIATRVLKSIVKGETQLVIGIPELYSGYEDFTCRGN